MALHHEIVLFVVINYHLNKLMGDSNNTFVFVMQASAASATATGQPTPVIAINDSRRAHLPLSNLIKLHVYLSRIYINRKACADAV